MGFPTPRDQRQIPCEGDQHERHEHVLILSPEVKELLDELCRGQKEILTGVRQLLKQSEEQRPN